MAGWLRRIHDSGEDPLVDPEEVEALLPSSVRGPEANRFTPLGSDMPDDAPDPDLAFFSTIAAEVEREGSATESVAEIASRQTNPRVASVDRDELRAFRELIAERDLDGRDRPRISVDHVDMADLLDDLATTAAALRGRKVA